MALVKYNNWASASGSVNGTTYSRNATGAYARNRSVPVNPSTVNQVAARNALTYGATNWRELTEPQRENWRIYAAGTPVVNKVGDTVHLKGHNWYAASAAFLNFVSAGTAFNEDAPPSPGLAIAVTWASNPIIDVSSDNVTLALATPATGVEWIGVWLSNPVSAGVAFFKGPWNYVGSAEAPVLPAVSISSVPIPLVAGNLHYVRVRYITSLNRLSPEFISGPYTVVA